MSAKHGSSLVIRGRWWGAGVAVVMAAALAAAPSAARAGEGHGTFTKTSAFTQTNLVSDVPGMAAITDPLVRTRGVSRSARQPRCG